MGNINDRVRLTVSPQRNPNFREVFNHLMQNRDWMRGLIAQGIPQDQARMYGQQVFANLHNAYGGGVQYFNQPQEPPHSPGFDQFLNTTSGLWGQNPLGTPSAGFTRFLNETFSRYGQPSASYQNYLQQLQERRDARSGVPLPPPQGAASPSAQRQSVTTAGKRTY